MRFLFLSKPLFEIRMIFARVKLLYHRSPQFESRRLLCRKIRKPFFKVGLSLGGEKLLHPCVALTFRRAVRGINSRPTTSFYLPAELALYKSEPLRICNSP